MDLLSFTVYLNIFNIPPGNQTWLVGKSPNFYIYFDDSAIGMPIYFEDLPASHVSFPEGISCILNIKTTKKVCLLYGAIVRVELRIPWWRIPQKFLTLETEIPIVSSILHLAVASQPAFFLLQITHPLWALEHVIMFSTEKFAGYFHMELQKSIKIPYPTGKSSPLFRGVHLRPWIRTMLRCGVQDEPQPQPKKRPLFRIPKKFQGQIRAEGADPRVTAVLALERRGRAVFPSFFPSKNGDWSRKPWENPPELKKSGDVIQVSQGWCRTEAGILAFHQSSRRLIPYLRQ